MSETLQLSNEKEPSSATASSFFEKSKQKNREKFMQLLEYSKTLMEETSIEEKMKIVNRMVQQLNFAEPFYVGSEEFNALLENSFHKMSDNSSSTFVALLEIKKVLKAHKSKLKVSKKGINVDSKARSSLSLRKNSISEDEHSVSLSAIKNQQTVNRPLSFEMTDDSISKDKFGEEKTSDSQSVDSLFSPISVKARKTFLSNDTNKSSKKILNVVKEKVNEFLLANATHSECNQNISSIDNIENSTEDLKLPSSIIKSVSKDFAIEKTSSYATESISKDNVLENKSSSILKAVSKSNSEGNQIISSAQSDVLESKFGSSSIASALGLRPIQKTDKDNNFKNKSDLLSDTSPSDLQSLYKTNNLPDLSSDTSPSGGLQSTSKNYNLPDFSPGASTSGLQSSTSKIYDLPSKSTYDSSFLEISKISTVKNHSSIHSPTLSHVPSSDERHKKTLEDDRNAARIKKLEKALADLDKAIKKCQRKELTLDDLDREDSAYLKESLYKKKFTQVYKKLCQLKKTTSRTGRFIEKKFNYEGSRYKAINEAIKKLINRKKAHEKFPDYVEILTCVKNINDVHDMGLSEREVSEEAKSVFNDVGQELQARRKKDERSILGCYLTDLNPEDDPAEHDENLRKTLKENHEKFEATITELVNEYVEKQKEGLGNSKEGNSEKEEEENGAEEEDGDESEKANELEGEDDLPLTDPASSASDGPPASKKDDDNDDIIIINYSDKSTDPNDESLGQKSVVKKEPGTQVGNQFAPTERSVIQEDIILEDSESSGLKLSK